MLERGLRHAHALHEGGPRNGVMTGIEVHDGAPKGPAQTRYAIIQDHGLRTWAMTAAVRSARPEQPLAELIADFADRRAPTPDRE